jgi:hypothetical protein
MVDLVGVYSGTIDDLHVASRLVTNFLCNVSAQYVVNIQTECIKRLTLLFEPCSDEVERIILNIVKAFSKSTRSNRNTIRTFRIGFRPHPFLLASSNGGRMFTRGPRVIIAPLDTVVVLSIGLLYSTNVIHSLVEGLLYYQHVKPADSAIVCFGGLVLPASKMLTRYLPSYGGWRGAARALSSCSLIRAIVPSTGSRVGVVDLQGGYALLQQSMPRLHAIDDVYALDESKVYGQMTQSVLASTVFSRAGILRYLVPLISKDNTPDIHVANNSFSHSLDRTYAPWSCRVAATLEQVIHFMEPVDRSSPLTRDGTFTQPSSDTHRRFYQMDDWQQLIITMVTAKIAFDKEVDREADIPWIHLIGSIFTFPIIHTLL